AQHRIFDVLANLLPRRNLEVMTVDIADEEIFVAALDRLFVGVTQQRLGIDFGKRQIAKIRRIHTVLPLTNSSNRRPISLPSLLRGTARREALDLGLGQDRLEVEEPLGVAAED